MNVDLAAPVHLVKGGDEVLLARALAELVRALVGDGDRSLMVEELTIDAHTGTDDQGYDIGALVDAAQTPPFLTERRVVVGRHAGVFSTKDSVAPLVAYLADPLPSTALVLVWERDPRPQRQSKLPNVPKVLVDAIAAAGGVVVDTSPGTGKARSGWIDEQLAQSSLRFDAGARRLVAEHVGDEGQPATGVARHPRRGVRARHRGRPCRGGAPTWARRATSPPGTSPTAIDGGDVPKALAVLDRMLRGGGRHPLQVMASLTNHYLRMIRLDDPDIRGVKDAAAVLEIKGSTFPGPEGAGRRPSSRSPTAWPR